MKCVNNISPDSDKCLTPCSGLTLTSYNKFEPKDFESLISDKVDDYKRFMNWFPLPSELKGKCYNLLRIAALHVQMLLLSVVVVCFDQVEILLANCLLAACYMQNA